MKCILWAPQEKEPIKKKNKGQRVERVVHGVQNQRLEKQKGGEETIDMCLLRVGAEEKERGGQSSAVVPANWGVRQKNRGGDRGGGKGGGGGRGGTCALLMGWGGLIVGADTSNAARTDAKFREERGTREKENTFGRGEQSNGETGAGKPRKKKKEKNKRLAGYRHAEKGKRLLWVLGGKGEVGIDKGNRNSEFIWSTNKGESGEERGNRGAGDKSCKQHRKVYIKANAMGVIQKRATRKKKKNVRDTLERHCPWVGPNVFSDDHRNKKQGGRPEMFERTGGFRGRSRGNRERGGNSLRLGKWKSTSKKH